MWLYNSIIEWHASGGSTRGVNNQGADPQPRATQFWITPSSHGKNLTIWYKTFNISHRTLLHLYERSKDNSYTL